MYRFVDKKDIRPDVAAFVDRVNGPEGQALFAPGGEVVVARAPGRLDVMGGLRIIPGRWCWRCRRARPRRWLCSGMDRRGCGW